MLAQVKLETIAALRARNVEKQAGVMELYARLIAKDEIAHEQAAATAQAVTAAQAVIAAHAVTAAQAEATAQAVT